MPSLVLGSASSVITIDQARQQIDAWLDAQGPLRRVLLIPPDITRHHSWAGVLTGMIYARLCAIAQVTILPALGTHAPMTPSELTDMYPGIPADRFHVHRWREDLSRLGEVPAEFVHTISDGKLYYSIPCEVNRLLVDEQWDRIISIGQVVPHEVAGMANEAKNIFVGTGGAETINKSHFLGAVCNMERAMGRAHTPVRAVFEYMQQHFAHSLPISYLLTVRGLDDDGQLVTRGLFAGEDGSAFQLAAELSREVNVNLLDAPLQRVVVYLRPDEYHSTWLGNKAIYRTRMAIADQGRLLVIAPGVKTFGEDPQIDHHIREHGYRGTGATLEAVSQHAELAANLSAAAHLIHGSSEGRFEIAYAAGGLTNEEITGVGYQAAELEAALERYNPQQLRMGKNVLADGERVFFISNPALGLWALRCRFNLQE
jgi:nickel-dependent lactate racemase